MYHAFDSNRTIDYNNIKTWNMYLKNMFMILVLVVLHKTLVYICMIITLA